MKTKILLPLFLGLLWIVGGRHETQAQGLVSVRHYSIEDGLSQNSIQNIVQDDDGYIWMGTWNGLEKFDGYTFTNYKSYPADEVRLQHNRLLYVAEGSGHTLWCETYNGKIYLFDTLNGEYIDVFSYHPAIPRESPQRLVALDNGVLWAIGHEGRLWRIDSSRYREKDGLVYLSSDSVLGQGTTVYEIVLGPDGKEWILTDKGCRVYGQADRLDNRVYRYAASVGNRMYLATAEGYLSVYDAQSGLKALSLPGEPDAIHGLFALKDGTIAVGIGRGVLLYDPQTSQYRTKTVADHANGVEPWYIFQTGAGDLWVFSGHNGQWSVLHGDADSDRLEFMDYPRAAASDGSFIHEDENGGVWMLPPGGEFSFYNAGNHRLERVYYYENGKKVFYSLTGINCFFDIRGNLWSRCTSGIDCISFSDGSAVFMPETTGQEVRGLFVDGRERLWVADKSGRVILYDKERTYLGNLDASGRLVKDKNVRLGINVYCFFEDSSGRIWLGSKGGGLCVGTPSGNGYMLSHYMYRRNDNYGLSNNSIYSICEDKQGRIWIATYGGGINLVEGTFPHLRFIHKDNELRNYPGDLCSFVRYVQCTSEGVILAGTTNGLLTFSSHFQSPEVINFFHNQCEEDREGSLSNSDVLYGFESKTHDIYVVTFGGGFSRVESGNLLSEHIKFSHYNRRNGLPLDMAYSMVEGGDGNLWITFENAVCKYNPVEQTFDTYDRFNLHTQLSITEVPPVVDSKGQMYVGTHDGVLRLDLNRMKKSSFVPPIVFTGADIRADDVRRVSTIEGNVLTLKADERNMSVTFAALDFTNREKLRYAYRLKGFNEQWTDIGLNHTASFVNLPAGDFVLEVKSTNGDGIWVDNVTPLTIHVAPTFWETGWAWVVYGLTILLVIVIVSGVLVYTLNLRRKVDFEQQLTNLKLRFFTDISHELRTPLTLITNPIEEVLSHEQLSEEGRNNMLTARRNTTRMLKLINQILDFRKIQNNKMKLYVEQADIVPLFKQTVDNFLSLAHQKNIRFGLECNVEHIMVYTDTDKLEKILFNLLSNAFKYTPDGKAISVIVSHTDGTLDFCVKDEGKGFEVMQIETLFQRFETLGRKDGNLSSGIGLSLVHELVQLLHGTIRVESVPGKGSSFHVSLPTGYDVFREDKNVEFILNDSTRTTVDQDVQEPSADENTPEEKDLSVLVVEDNDELRTFLVSMLRRDYAVQEASNGKIGLEQVVATLPDIIISDVMMPEMDGIELLDAVKQRHETCHIPFILLSAKSSLDDRIKGLEYGADDYITKPFSSGYLRARIHSLLKQREVLRRTFTESKGDVAKQEEETLSSAISVAPSMPQITRFDEVFIKQVVQAVESDIQNPDFKIEDLADTMQMSRTVFYRKIKSLFGVSPIDFVRDMRVKRAVQLLDSGEYTVSEVAYMSGFSSPQYFSRVFKNLMKCTPTEYKDTVKSS